jgi:2-polyprenyl-6-methoxyphenol hydroxylase-like FAD-dependent oxidoreductase
MRNRTILISGAGIAGPALAYWLLRHGFEPTIIEQAPALRTGGYIVDFWGIGWNVAERMGILPQLVEDGYQIEEMRFVNDRGTRVGGFDASLLRAASGEQFTSLLRGDLARDIYATVDGRVETIFADSVHAIQQDQGGVDVTFECSAPRRFDLVIGADGLHSAVRRRAFAEEPTFEHYLGYCTAAFSSVGYPHRDERAYVSYSAPARQIARYALRDGRSAFFFVFVQPSRPAAIHQSAVEQRALLRRIYGDAGWECREILDVMESADDIYLDGVSQIRMDSWSRGRVALVGDAAFCPSPLAGQASGFALASAYLLAGELAAAGGDHTTAFSKYESRFKPFVEAKQRAAARFGGWFVPRTRFSIWFRNQTTNLMNLPFLSSVLLKRASADGFELPEY